MKRISALDAKIYSAIPYATDDSLSWYEFLAKVLYKLNEIIESTNSYFDVDLPQYTENVLNEWYVEGRLEDIINEVLFDSKADKTTVNALIDELGTHASQLAKKADKTTVNALIDKLDTHASQLAEKAQQTALETTNNNLTNGLNTKVDKGGTEQVTWAMVSQDVKENITGGNTAVVGVNSVNTSNIVNNSVTSTKRTSMGEFGILNCLNGVIDFDFVGNVVKIPSTTNLTFKRKYFTSSQITGGVNLEIPMSPYAGASEMVLMFNTETLAFEVKNTTTILSANENEITIAMLSRAFLKVAMIGDYAINGVNHYLKTSDLITETLLPSYVTDEIKNTHDKVSLKTGMNKLTFAYITDVHEQLDHLKALAEYCKMGGLDFVVVGGDQIATEKDITLIRDYYKKQATILGAIQQPIFTNRGNHDGDNADDFSISEWTNRLVKPYHYKSKMIVDVNNPNGGYYYRDFEDKKIRLIMLNTSETPSRWQITRTQLAWLGEYALKLDKGVDNSNWAVLVIGHHPTRQEFTVTPPVVNGEVLEGILSSFKDGTVFNDGMTIIDFSTQGSMNLVGYFFGHTHYDYMGVPSGITYPMISTVCSTPDYYESPPNGNISHPRATGTVTEDAWDVFIVDTETKLIESVRYGAGMDRSIYY